MLTQLPLSTLPKEKIIIDTSGYSIQYENPIDLLKGYKQIKAITFSSSAKAMIELLKGYEQIELLIGLEEKGPEFLEFSNLLNVFKTELKNYLLDIKDLSVYYVPSCHSKLYLLYNENNKLAITGSANLSLSAWKGEQAEIFVLIQEDQLIQELEKYYYNMKEKSKEFFISNKIKKEIKKKADNFLRININIDNAEDLEKVLMNKEIQNEIEHIYIKNISNFPISNELHHAKSFHKNIERNLLFVDSIIQNKKIIATPQGFRQVISQIEREKDEKEVKIDVVGTQIILDKKNVKEFNILDSSIKNIVNTLKEYMEDTKTTSENYPYLLSEAIAFAFYSVFLKNIRTQIISENKNMANFPAFALLLGQSGAGKTILLQIISQLLGSSYIHYQGIKTSKNSKAVTIEEWLMSKERLPLLIDEVKSEHLLDNKSLGEILKTMGENEKINRGLILTSNLQQFESELQTTRRSCFLPFTAQLEEKAKKKISKVLKCVDNQLFIKFLQSINIENIEINESDPFFFVRNFLINEGLPMSETYYGNYRNFMLQKWREFYLLHKEKFIETVAFYRKNKNQKVEVFKIARQDVKFLLPLESFDNESVTSSEYYILLKKEFLKEIGAEEQNIDSTQRGFISKIINKFLKK